MIQLKMVPFSLDDPMDYEGRDDFNNWLLRGFSVLGLVTVISGFVLWFVSSPTVRKTR